MTSPDKLCKNCRFWDLSSNDKTYRLCRRYPPNVADGSVAIDGAVYPLMTWPNLHQGQSCGEWKKVKP